MLKAIKYVIVFCAISVLFTRCFDDNLKEIPIEGRICLLQSERNLNDGFDIVLKNDEHFPTVLVEANPVEVYHTTSQILIKRNDHGLIRYYRIVDHKKMKEAKVVELKKIRFDEEVRNCVNCKKISLALDINQHEWKVKK